jgi:hypothetical protein
MYWDKAKLTKASIFSRAGSTCVLRTTVPVSVTGVAAVSEEVPFYNTTHYITTFPTVEGKLYHITAQ